MLDNGGLPSPPQEKQLKYPIVTSNGNMECELDRLYLGLDHCDGEGAEPVSLHSLASVEGLGEELRRPEEPLLHHV